jgi:hypothetical protein
MKKHSLIISSIWAFTVMHAHAVTDPKQESSALDLPAISTFTKNSQNELKVQQGKLNQIGMEKGHDESIGKLLAGAAQALDKAQVGLKRLEDIKKLPREITNQLALATGQIQSASLLKVSAPKSYPERCLILTLDSQGQAKAKKDDLVEKTGIIETFGGPNTWVLTTYNSNAKDGADRHHLDEKVGMIGSSDPSAALLVRGHTPKDMYVKGWVNKEGKVMCVSKAMSGNPQN